MFFFIGNPPRNTKDTNREPLIKLQSRKQEEKNHDKALIAHHHILKRNTFVLLPFTKTDKWCVLHGSIIFIAWRLFPAKG